MIQIAGAGIRGLSCALYLLEKNHEVTIFESRQEIGALCLITFSTVIIETFTVLMFRSNELVASASLPLLAKRNEDVLS